MAISIFHGFPMSLPWVGLVPLLVEAVTSERNILGKQLIRRNEVRNLGDRFLQRFGWWWNAGGWGSHDGPKMVS